jgi:hypothetical protein
VTLWSRENFRAIPSIELAWPVAFWDGRKMPCVIRSHPIIWHFKNAASTALELGHHDSRVTLRNYRELVKPKDAERYWSLRPERADKIVRIPKAQA